MPDGKTIRLRNRATGAVVNVRDGKVLLGYEPVEDTAEQDTAGQDEPTEEAAAGYSSRTVADLRAEVERRNEGRDEADRLPTEGKKVDLVAALEADDSK